MATDFERLLGWALTLFNFGVTAVVAWALALLIAAHTVQPQVVQVEPFAPTAGFNSLGFVSMPTAYVPADNLPNFAGSAVVAPEGGGTIFRPH